MRIFKKIEYILNNSFVDIFMNKKFIRIIPKLDIKNGLLIKGINLEGLRVLGDPAILQNFIMNVVLTKFAM